MELRDAAIWAFSGDISITKALVLLFATILLPILVHYFLYKQAKSVVQPTFLLIGPSGAGKTTLLTLLANGRPSPTQTSQVPQSAQCQLPSTIRSSEDRYRSEHDVSSRSQPRFQVLDTPGHGKLRHHARAALQSNSTLTGIIFAVDSAALSSPAGLAEAAEYLYDVLLTLQKRHAQNKTSKNPRAIPVLVVANKQDVFTSLPTNMVKSKLEQEIAKVRSTKSKGLLDSGVTGEDQEGDEEQNWLGEYGTETFSFGHMQEHDVEVEVLGGSALERDGGASKIDTWLEWIGQSI